MGFFFDTMEIEVQIARESRLEVIVTYPKFFTLYPGKMLQYESDFPSTLNDFTWKIMGCPAQRDQERNQRVCGNVKVTSSNWSKMVFKMFKPVKRHVLRSKAVFKNIIIYDFV